MSISSKSFSLFQRDIFLFFTKIVTGVVIARILGPTALGLWAILKLIPSYAEGFGRMKVDIAAVYFLGKGKYRFGEMIFILNLLALVSSLLIVIALVWGFDYFYQLLFQNSETDVRMLAYFIMTIIPIRFLTINYRYLHIYREDVHTYNLMKLIQALLSSVISIVLLISTNLRLPIVIFASIFASITALVYGAVKLEKNIKMIPNLNMAMIKDLLSYGSKFYLAGVIGTLNVRITNLIIALYLLPSQLAFFSMARNKENFILKIPNAINTIIFPRISKLDDIEKSKRLTTKSFRVLFLILFVVGILMIIIIYPWILFLYGKNYLPAVLPTCIMMPGFIFSASTGVFNQYFSGTGRADILLKISIVPLVIQIILALILIPVWGLIGASIVFLTTVVLESFIRIIVFRYVSSSSIRNDLFPKKEDFQLVASFLSSLLGKMRGTFSKYVFFKR